MKRSINDRKPVAKCKSTTPDAGIEIVQSLTDDPMIRNVSDLFGMNTSNRVVVLCDSSGKPLTDKPLSDMLDFVCNTGGVPPRAGYNGNKWMLMNLTDIRADETLHSPTYGKFHCLFYSLEPFGRKTHNEKTCAEALPDLSGWTFGRIARPKQMGSLYVPGGAMKMDIIRTVDMKLAVLNDAIEANDFHLACVMVRSIRNLVETCTIPRVPNPMDPSFLADDLAHAVYARHHAVKADDCDFYEKLRVTSHPWDWYCAWRLIVCGMAQTPDDSCDTSAALYERSVLENKNNLMLSMMFDPISRPMAEVVAPYFVMRGLTDTMRTTNQIFIRGTTVDDMTLELLDVAAQKLPVLRTAFLVLSVSRMSHLAFWTPRNAESALMSMHESCDAIRTVPDAVIALYPDADMHMDMLHYSIANLVLCGMTLGRKDMKGKMVSSQMLVSSTIPAELIDFAKERKIKGDELVGHAMDLREKTPTWSDFKNHLVAHFTCQVGNSTTMKEIYARLALEIKCDGTRFVREALSDDDFFVPARTILRLLRPMLCAPHADKALETMAKINECGTNRRHRTTEQLRYLRAELEEHRDMAKSVGERRSQAFGITTSNNWILNTSTGHPLKKRVHRGFGAFDPANLVVNPLAAIDFGSVAPADPVAMMQLRKAIQARVEEAEELHACPICFETDGVMVDVHVENRHPDDYKVCTGCHAQLHACPFCRVGI